MGSGAKEVDAGLCGGDCCCKGTKGCECVVLGENVGSAAALIAVGGSIRLAIDGDADARFTCGDA